MRDRFLVQASKAYLTHTMADKFIIQFILSPKPQVYKLGIAYSEKYLRNHYISKVLSFFLTSDYIQGLVHIST